MADDSCVISEPKPLKSVAEAMDFLLSHAKAITDTEIVNTVDAFGRVLAEPVKSAINVPPWNNSAMDGYAFNHADVRGLVSNSEALPVSQRIPAGVSGNPLEPGTAARIFTGAPLPANADTVVMQEHCSAGQNTVTIDKLPGEGENVRLAGEDVSINQVVIESGTRLSAQHLGMAASVGAKQLVVYRRLRVAIFSSGDELAMPGETLAPGQIYNSNQFTLVGLLQAFGCETINLGRVKDTFEATCEALSSAAEKADLILASGGVSVGEEDHVKPAVEHLGELNLWKIAIRPGKPLAFGHIDNVPFIGAPGNPVSLFVTFCVFARPFIKIMQGISGDVQPAVLPVKAAFSWNRPDKRREYARARLVFNEQGEASVHTYPSRSSGVLSSVTWANGLVVIESEQLVEPGDRVNFIPFNELLS